VCMGNAAAGTLSNAKSSKTRGANPSRARVYESVRSGIKFRQNGGGRLIRFPRPFTVNCHYTTHTHTPFPPLETNNKLARARDSLIIRADSPRHTHTRIPVEIRRKTVCARVSVPQIIGIILGGGQTVDVSHDLFDSGFNSMPVYYLFDNDNKKKIILV